MTAFFWKIQSRNKGESMTVPKVVIVLLFSGVFIGLGYGSWLLAGFMEHEGPAWVAQLAIATLFFTCGGEIITKTIEYLTR